MIEFEAECKTSFFESNAIKLCSGKIYNDKGGDVRCIFDVCKKALRNKYDEMLKTQKIEPVTTMDLWKTYQELYQPSIYKDIIDSLPQNFHLCLVVAFNLRKRNNNDL